MRVAPGSTSLEGAAKITTRRRGRGRTACSSSCAWWRNGRLVAAAGTRPAGDRDEPRALGPPAARVHARRAPPIVCHGPRRVVDAAGGLTLTTAGAAGPTGGDTGTVSAGEGVRILRSRPTPCGRKTRAAAPLADLRVGDQCARRGERSADGARLRPRRYCAARSCARRARSRRSRRGELTVKDELTGKLYTVRLSRRSPRCGACRARWPRSSRAGERAAREDG